MAELSTVEGASASSENGGPRPGSDLDLQIFGPREYKRLLRTPQRLRASLRWRMRLCSAALVVFAALAAALLWQFGPPVWEQHPLLFWLVIAVSAIRFFAMLRPVWEIEAVRIEDASENEKHRNLLGRYSAGEIRATADAVGKRLGGVDVPNLYVAIDKSANAVAVNSMFFNFARRFNAIYLNSYLFKALDREELEALLVHELAHFHRYMNPLTRNAWMRMPLSIGSVFAVFALMPSLAGAWYWVILTLLLAPAPLGIFFNLLANWRDRDLEYASDATAAQVVGALPVVNALLKIGDRAEVFEFIEDEIGRIVEEHPAANIGQLVSNFVEKLPEEHIDLEQARKLVSEIMTGRLEDGTETSNKSFLDKIAVNRKRRQALTAIRWSDFDVIHRDGKLDAEELEKYLGALLFCERTATHRLAGHHPETEKEESHPSLRKRIVYIYLHYQRDACSMLSSSTLIYLA